jgi:hypothetical protein
MFPADRNALKPAGNHAGFIRHKGARRALLCQMPFFFPAIGNPPDAKRRGYVMFPAFTYSLHKTGFPPLHFNGNSFMMF